jgi:hypothetical protein
MKPIFIYFVKNTVAYCNASAAVVNAVAVFKAKIIVFEPNRHMTDSNPRSTVTGSPTVNFNTQPKKIVAKKFNVPTKK